MPIRGTPRPPADCRPQRRRCSQRTSPPPPPQAAGTPASARGISRGTSRGGACRSAPSHRSDRRDAQACPMRRSPSCAAARAPRDPDSPSSRRERPPDTAAGPPGGAPSAAAAVPLPAASSRRADARRPAGNSGRPAAAAAAPAGRSARGRRRRTRRACGCGYSESCGSRSADRSDPCRSPPLLFKALSPPGRQGHTATAGRKRLLRGIRRGAGSARLQLLQPRRERRGADDVEQHQRAQRE